MSNDIALLLNSVKNFKTGWKTSEFWVALSPIVVGILSVFGVHGGSGATAHFVVAVWGAVAAVYVASRTLVKSIHIGHAANLSVLLKQLENEGLQAAKELEGQAAKQDVKKDPAPDNVHAWNYENQLIARPVEEDDIPLHSFTGEAFKESKEQPEPKVEIQTTVAPVESSVPPGTITSTTSTSPPEQ